MNIRINQLGYTPSMKKTAVLCGRPAEDVLLRNAQGDVVMRCPLTEAAASLWGDRVFHADFSALVQPGVYTLECGAERSHPFVVSHSSYERCLTALTDMLHYQRCGCALSPETGRFAHPPCHTSPARIYGTQETVDVSGGWHDAGDFGRYIVPAAKAVADVLLAVSWNADALRPTLSDLWEELRWELEWMLKMQRADGGVYHKVTSAVFCDMIMPHEDDFELLVLPVSTTATGDFAACTAMASRYYAAVDPAFSLRLKTAAVRAWDYLNAHEPALFHNPDDVRTGEYGDDSDADERLWAHVELALTCGEEPYLSAAARALAQADRSEAILGWADVRGYAAIEGLALPGESGRICREWVLSEARRLLGQMNAYGITMTDSLPWGSNMNVSNDGMMFYQAWLLTGERAFLDAAQAQLHYLLGVNPMGCCYVTGFGSKTVLHPHHRPSVAQKAAQPGMLSGGPASGMMDPCAQRHLKDCPPGKSYIDDDESYSTNEICIYWNSPLIALLAGLVKA